MDKFTAIDINTWHRKGEYEICVNVMKAVTFSTTKRLDVTKTVKHLKDKGYKFASALIWLVCKVFSEQQNFRMAIKDGKLGYWDVIHPVYSRLNKWENLTFYCTKFDGDYKRFNKQYLLDKDIKPNSDEYGVEDSTVTEIPENSFLISIANFINFDSFSYQLKHPQGYYMPVVEIGKYIEDEKGNFTLPCSIMVNHAVLDLWHVHSFFERMQDLLYAPEKWC